jgi:hypothetical protein
MFDDWGFAEAGGGSLTYGDQVYTPATLTAATGGQSWGTWLQNAASSVLAFNMQMKATAAANGIDAKQNGIGVDGQPVSGGQVAGLPVSWLILGAGLVGVYLLARR